MADVATELENATAAVRESEDVPHIGWAWVDAEYRASPSRAFLGERSALTIADEGMPALERAMQALLRDQRVTTRWRDEDLWTMVLSLVAAASAGHVADLHAAVDRLLKPKRVRVAAAVANITWNSEPMSIGALTLAEVHGEADVRELANTLKLDARAEESLVGYAQQLLQGLNAYVVATLTTDRQGELASQDFERAFEDLIGLTLMLADDLEAHGIYSLRGSTNRPGIRGVTLDRSAIVELLADHGSAELGARVLTITGWNSGNNFRWYSADPLPLDRILGADLRVVIDDLMTAPDAIAQRLRVAARWYARAFWAEAEDDSALAVSVALDSLLTGKDAVPGAVSKSRFALLERDPAARGVRFERYEALYKVRSAIAHGGDATRRLAQIGGARSILKDAHWVAMKLLELRDISTPPDEKEFRELWAAVQWGALEWAHPSESGARDGDSVPPMGSPSGS